MKFKITIEAEIEADAKEVREELGIDKDDDIVEAVQTTISDNLTLGIDAGETSITNVSVKN